MTKASGLKQAVAWHLYDLLCDGHTKLTDRITKIAGVNTADITRISDLQFQLRVRADEMHTRYFTIQIKEEM